MPILVFLTRLLIKRQLRAGDFLSKIDGYFPPMPVLTNLLAGIGLESLTKTEETSQLAFGVTRKMPRLEVLERLIAVLQVQLDFCTPNGESSV